MLLHPHPFFKNIFKDACVCACYGQITHNALGPVVLLIRQDLEWSLGELHVTQTVTLIRHMCLPAFFSWFPVC